MTETAAEQAWREYEASIVLDLPEEDDSYEADEWDRRNDR